MRYIILFLLLLPFSSAAIMHGRIYDMALVPVENAVLTINTSPPQRYVATNSTYTFEVSPGSYSLRVVFSDLEAEESIRITGEGDYVFDLLLFPEIVEEEDLYDSLDFEPSLDFAGPTNHVMVAALIFISALAFCIILLRTRPSHKSPGHDKPLEALISIMRENGNRMTQKELRKEMALSEAKVSLMVTELVSRGRMKKIKKGRGNVLVLENFK